MIKNKDKIFKLSLQLSLIFFSLQAGLLIFFWKKLPPQGPLFYSRPWGEKQLANPKSYLLIPALSLFILLVNLSVTNFLTKEPLANRLLMFFSAIFNFLCLFTLLKIFILIT